MLRTPLTAALLALALSACSPSDPLQKTSSALASGVLLPAYNHWLSADQQLAASSQAFCNANADLAATRLAWLNAQSAWSALQPLLVGPLSEGNRAWQVQFWPDKKNLVARQVEALLQSKTALTPADLDKASVVVQGLSASEYLLFDTNIDLTQAAQKNRYCPLLIAIGTHQQALASDILGQWQSADGMLAQLQSFPNTRYADSQEAITDLLRTQVTGLEGMKKKLGTPLGRQSKGQPQPFQAEAWRSNASLSNLSASLNAAEQLWLGSQADGLRSLLSSQQAELANRIDNAYQDSRLQLAAQQKSLSQLLADDAGRQQLNALYDSLNTLHRLHESELAKALGIQLGFNANDGD
ncbi:MAG: imelysin family protein [Pseudomonas sp.]|nr:imelysin family protein [Pseudomonas sp.]